MDEKSDLGRCEWNRKFQKFTREIIKPLLWKSVRRITEYTVLVCLSSCFDTDWLSFWRGSKVVSSRSYLPNYPVINIRLQQLCITGYYELGIFQFTLHHGDSHTLGIGFFGYMVWWMYTNYQHKFLSGTYTCNRCNFRSSDGSRYLYDQMKYWIQDFLYRRSISGLTFVWREKMFKSH